MGQEPDRDAGVIVDEPEFDAQGLWNLGVNYSIADGSCNFEKIDPAFGSVFQTILDLEQFYWYLIFFEIKAVNFASGNTYIEVIIGGNVALTGLKTVGLHKALTQNFVGGFAATWAVFLPTIGDTVEIELFDILPASNYPQDQLGLNIPGDQKTEIQPGTGGDVSQILASRDGKTNVGILYDF